MAVTDKRKKQRNQAPKKGRDPKMHQEPESNRSKKNKRVRKAINQESNINQKNNSNKLQSKKKTKERKKMNVENIKYLVTETLKKFKDMIFWSLILIVMFYMRFAGEIYGKNQHLRVSEDFYKILESEPHFTVKEIKSSFRKLVNQYHPDKNPDCESCEEKITLINKAYETLKNKDARKIYDLTRGVVDPIYSSSKSLTIENYRAEILESGKPHIIQIYEESNKTSRSFAAFWEEFIVEHSYMNYARINKALEPELIRSFEFGVDELPFIFSYVPGRDYEFFEFNQYYEGSTLTLLKNFLKKVVKRNAAPIEFKTFLTLDREDDIQVIFVKREFSPIVFENLALHFKNKHNIKFFATKMNEHRKFYNHFKKDDIDYIILMPKGMENGIRVVKIDHNQIEAGSSVTFREKK